MVVFGAMISIGLIFSYALHGGLFPVVFVGVSPITLKVLDEMHFAAMRYYGNMVKTYGSDPNELNDSETKQEVRRASLSKLIDEVLIKNELKKRLGKNLNLVVRNKLGEISKNEEFRNATTLFYGLNLNELERVFLIPQAEYEILEGRLIIEQKEIKDWLNNARHAANVTILSSEFKWNGASVELRD